MQQNIHISPALSLLFAFYGLMWSILMRENIMNKMQIRQTKSFATIFCRSTNATGSVCVNGRPRDMRIFRRISRYIMQEDLLQPHLSVHEAMHAASQLKLGLRLDPKQRKATVSF
jgi:hypothetical protein